MKFRVRGQGSGVRVKRYKCEAQRCPPVGRLVWLTRRAAAPALLDLPHGRHVHLVAVGGANDIINVDTPALLYMS